MRVRPDSPQLNHAGVSSPVLLPIKAVHATVVCTGGLIDQAQIGKSIVMRRKRRHGIATGMCTR